MGFWEFVSAWYNVMFLAPLLLVFLFAFLQVVGVSLEFGGSTEVDVDSDIDIDVDSDIDIDTDLDVDSEVEFDNDVGADGPGVFVSMLGFLNVGKVPLMVLIMTWLTSYGAVGLICNRVIGNRILRLIPPLAAVSAGIAFVASIFCTKYFAMGIAKIFPESEPAISRRDLVGMTARVVSGRVTSAFGRVAVHTGDNTTLKVACRVEEGDEEPVNGDEVLLEDYDPATQIFVVAKFEGL